jgi:hypothetical protein
MRTIRITVGDAGDPGGSGRRRIGLWLLTALALLILIGAVPAGVLAYETLDLRTGRSLASVTTEVEAASWEGTAWADEAAWLTIASPYRVAFGAGAVTRVWPWQSLSNCQNIGGKVVCTR